MASLSNYLTCNTVKSSLVRNGLTRHDHNQNKQNPNNVKVNGNSTSSGVSTAKFDVLNSHNNINVAAAAAMAVVKDEIIRQNIPTKKQFVDPHRQGLIVEEGVGYRQTVVVRSYEVGPDKTATIDTILNLLQETALNHVWISGLLGNGFGATHGMMRNNLIWVVSRMQVQVDHYPIWGEVIEMDTWVGASGKNGIRRDWILRSHTTGLIFARATSTWVMMNRETRRIAKMPEEVRAEISPWFIDKHAIGEDDAFEKIEKLKDNAKYVNSGLKPKRSDVDMNHHVNNVKYVGWMLETIPEEFLENYQLSNIIMEYRRECGSSETVESLCQPQDERILEDGNKISRLNGILGSLSEELFKYTHLLQIKGAAKNEEIVRGRTTWKRKLSTVSFST